MSGGWPNSARSRCVESFAIERFSHVMHISSTVQGKLRPGLSALDALTAGFPAGTLSGAPKVRAMQIIEELEPMRRGIYGGCIGYFAPDGTMDTCIGLRTAVVKDGVMYVQAGGGVVADSVPELEYEESRHKARALFRAAEEAVRFAASAEAEPQGLNALPGMTKGAPDAILHQLSRRASHGLAFRSRCF